MFNFGLSPIHTGGMHHDFKGFKKSVEFFGMVSRPRLDWTEGGHLAGVMWDRHTTGVIYITTTNIFTTEL